MKYQSTFNHKKDPGQERILLAVLPYWTPLIPPAGITCLKSFLTKNGYPVKTVDANVVPELREIYDRYFDTLRGLIPKEKHSIFENIGKEVWQNHMMAHLHHTNEQEYVDLVKILVYETFYWKIYDHHVY